MFEAVNLFYFWLVLAIFFLFTEIATPGLFVFVAFAVGSVAAAVAAFFGYSLFVQCWSLFIAAVFIINAMETGSYRTPWPVAIITTLAGLGLFGYSWYLQSRQQ